MRAYVDNIQKHGLEDLQMDLQVMGNGEKWNGNINIDKFINLYLDKPRGIGRLIFRSSYSSKEKHMSEEQRKRGDWVNVCYILHHHSKEFEKLEKWAHIFMNAKANSNSSRDWIRSLTCDDIISYYRREQDGTLSVKIEDKMSDAPLFEQIAVLKEVDLYHEWSPFYHKSRKRVQHGRIDVLTCNIPGMGKVSVFPDICFYSECCNCIWEDGSIILVAEGIENIRQIEDTDEETSNISNTSDGVGMKNLEFEFTRRTCPQLIPDIKSDTVTGSDNFKGKKNSYSFQNHNTTTDICNSQSFPNYSNQRRLVI